MTISIKHARMNFGWFVSPCIIFCLVASTVSAQQTQQASPGRLSEIVSAAQTYSGSTVTMKLKLKTVDQVFERIIFYDVKNHDIVFDIASRATKKRLKNQMMNLHEGLDYSVTFKVDKIDNNGMIIAELVDFRPVVLDLLP